jgi:hypothetical protein
MPIIQSPRLEQSEEHGLVRLCAGMGLHIDISGTEKFPGAADRDLLDRVDMLAAAIVAASGIALGIFVGQDGSLRGENVGGGDVLRGNQLDLVLLPLQFAFDGGRYGVVRDAVI